jgi:hypothetical protein
MRKKESQILKVDVMPFDEAIASGTWKLKTNRPLLSEKEGSQNTASHEMVAGGKGIRDPLVKNAEVMGGTNVETIGLRSCVIDGVAVALEVPDSVRLRRRPSLTATLVRAIRQQGLVRRGTSVVVPYFDNHDPGVFIALENSAGGCEVLTAHNLGGGSWAFHPASEIKTGSGISEACRKIESAGMVKLHESRTDQWIE